MSALSATVVPRLGGIADDIDHFGPDGSAAAGMGHAHHAELGGYLSVAPDPVAVCEAVPRLRACYLNTLGVRRPSLVSFFSQDCRRYLSKRLAFSQAPGNALPCGIPGNSLLFGKVTSERLVLSPSVAGLCLKASIGPVLPQTM